MKTALPTRDTNRMARGFFDIVKNAEVVDNGQGHPNLGTFLKPYNRPQNMDGWNAIKEDEVVTKCENLSQKAQEQESLQRRRRLTRAFHRFIESLQRSNYLILIEFLSFKWKHRQGTRANKNNRPFLSHIGRAG